MGAEFGCNICTVCRHLRATSTKPKSLQTSISKEVLGLSLFWSAFYKHPFPSSNVKTSRAACSLVQSAL